MDETRQYFRDGLVGVGSGRKKHEDYAWLHDDHLAIRTSWLEFRNVARLAGKCRKQIIITN
jgi:hypothetical protein